MYGSFFLGSGLFIMIPLILFAMYTQSKVKKTFNKYLKVPAQRNYTGFEVARKILNNNGLSDIEIKKTSGRLSDHYDPRNKTVNLSQDVYSGTSIASISVAAHEVGHALQHSLGYTPLTVRSLIAPVASFTSKFVWVLVFAGIFFSRGTFLIDVGIAFYLAVILFHVFTLPVEFNASNRALIQLENNNLVYQGEIAKSKKVLNAAALTYVAQAAVAVGQLIRLLILRNARD